MVNSSPENQGIKAAFRTNGQLSISALPNIPLVQPGNDLTDIIINGLVDCGLKLQDGDILVLAQKIVSKSEDRYAVLDSVTPSAAALELAGEVEKDPRLVELILSIFQQLLPSLRVFCMTHQDLYV